VYLEIRRIQDAHQETQRLLSEIERNVYLISITVREVLLDSSTTSLMYKRGFEQKRNEIEQHVSALQRQLVKDSRISMPKLEQELEGYFSAIEPVFDWTPGERATRATYFLREQQRPRRQTVIAIADEIGRLNEASYSKQLDQVNQSQVKFGEDIQRVIAVAFLVGVTIAAITFLRLMTLEDRAEQHRSKPCLVCALSRPQVDSGVGRLAARGLI